MELDILCEVPFSDEDVREIETATESLKMSQEELIRAAVKAFVAECVPTQTATDNAA